MRSALLTIVMVLFTAAAAAQNSNAAIGDEKAGAEQASDKAEPKSSVTTEAGGPGEFKLPPGFKEKKRGKITVYCIKGKATGTRFQTESCYDKAQLHDYLLAREQNNRDFDRSRATCVSVAACGSN